MRTLARILLVIVASLLVCAAALYATAWHHRIQAEHLLAAVRKLKVGVTSQAEYEQAIRPFIGDAEQVRGGNAGQPISGAYAIAPVPSWVFKALLHIPEPIASTLSTWSVLRWTIFEVEPTFKEGTLALLTVREMQGDWRPYAGFVRIHAGIVQHLFPDSPEPFLGYFAQQMGGHGTVISTSVDMDDRATPEERRRALDFRFSCFTAFRGCDDGRQLFDPVISDPLP